MKIYTTKAGETWDGIAYNLYGDEFRMTELLAANAKHSEVVVFLAGTTLVVPEIEIAVSEVLPPWKK